MTRAAVVAAAVAALSFLTVTPGPIQRAGSARPEATPAALAPTAPEVVAPEAAVAPAPAAAQPVEAAPPPPVDPGPWTVMLIGDSMAFTAAQGLAPHAAGWDLAVANEGIMGCGVVRGGPFRYFGAQRDFEARCDAWPTAWQDAVARNQPDLVGIFVGRWELMDRVHDGRWTNLFDPTFVRYVENEVAHSVAVARSGGAKVVLFTAPYYRRGLTPDGGLFPEDDPARVDIMNGILRRVAEWNGVAVVDVGGWLSPEGRYTPEVAGVKVRSDGVHLTRQTGAVMAPWLFPQLRAVMQAPAPVPPAVTPDPVALPAA